MTKRAQNDIHYAVLLAILLVTGAFLHFYNLNWGAPFYFHPDERNIASSVSQLRYPQQMNPHFFAYGSLPIYTIYFTGMLFNFVAHYQDNTYNSVLFESAIVISRFYSALFATLLILLMYKIGTLLRGKHFGILCAFFTTASVGFVQFSHFGTFEFWLTFFSVLLYWYCLKTSKGGSDLPLIKMAGIFGILVATKVSHLAALVLPFFSLIQQEIGHKTKIRPSRSIVHIIHGLIICICVATIIYILSNPFVFRTPKEFFDSMQFESGVAFGTLPVFYSGEFFTAIPVIFQFLHVYPFLLNPIMTILFIPAFFYFIYLILHYRKKEHAMLFMFFLVLFASQAFLYVKWTRYMVPTLPFILLILLICIDDLFRRIKSSLFSLIFTVFLCLAAMLFTFSYFITAFVHQDTRIAAEQYAKMVIPGGAPILSEVYDLGITPFNNDFTNITLFNFYELDNNNPEYSSPMLESQLAASDYLILPSQRLVKIRLEDKKKFPNGHDFYTRLFNGETQFKKIYETPCDFFCKITYLNSPVFSFEETANVFDRPEVYIFKKN